MGVVEYGGIWNSVKSFFGFGESQKVENGNQFSHDSLVVVNGERLPVTWDDYKKGNGITTPFSDDHQGIDISLFENTPILADGDGVVIKSKWENKDDWNQGYGQYILVDYGNGIQKLYGHLNQRNYEAGGRVHPGDVLGLSGDTGRSSGPHLHYEKIKNGKYINPIMK
jgi:murein DD-endopeptidase MepM/ murein hydrolase activator NlpD